MKKTLLNVFENLRIYRQKSFLFSTHIFLFYSDFPCPLAVLVTKRRWCLLCKELRRQYFSFSKADLHYLPNNENKPRNTKLMWVKRNYNCLLLIELFCSRYFFQTAWHIILWKMTTIWTRREAQVPGWYISIDIQSNNFSLLYWAEGFNFEFIFLGKNGAWWPRCKNNVLYHC